MRSRTQNFPCDGRDDVSMCGVAKIRRFSCTNPRKQLDSTFCYQRGYINGSVCFYFVHFSSSFQHLDIKCVEKDIFIVTFSVF
jgi:hypothetical protein